MQGRHQPLEATVRETVDALRRRGSDFTEKLAEVLVNAQGSGFYMAHAIIDLAAIADSGNVRRLKAAFQGGRCNLLDLPNVAASERVLAVLHTFVEVIDEQRALADLPPLADVMPTGIVAQVLGAPSVDSLSLWFGQKANLRELSDSDIGDGNSIAVEDGGRAVVLTGALVRKLANFTRRN